MMNKLIISDVKIINHDHIIDNADIIIENAKIKKIIHKNGQAKKTAIPGFIELHIHGFGGGDAMDSTSAIEMMSCELGKIGVTTFLPTLMTAKWDKVLQSLENASKAKTINAKIGGLHLEGPFISRAKKGAHNPDLLMKLDNDKINKMLEVTNNQLVRLVIAPECNSDEVIKYATSKNIVVALGHTNASAKIVHNAINKLGATAMTHLWNGMSGVVNRDPGATEAALNNDNVYAELICDLVHVDSESINLAIKTKGTNKIIVISDSIRPAGLPDGEYSSGGLPVIKEGNKITLKELGSIAGGAGSIDVGFRTLLSLHYSLQDIVKMTSYNPSVNQHLKNIGILKTGAYADINILDNNNNIIQTYINGRIVNKDN